MSLFNFSENAANGGGTFLPIVKYDARNGEMKRRDRINDGSGWVTNEVDISKNFKAIIDLENIETGWIDFQTGGAPIFALCSPSQERPAKPTPTAKQGCRLVIKLAKECGGEQPIREMASNAKAFLEAINEIYNAYKAEASANSGKLPIVVMDGTEKKVSGSGAMKTTNYKPKFKITGWAARGDLQPQPRGASAITTPTPAAPPSTGSTQVPPPAAKAAAPATTDDDDFG